MDNRIKKIIENWKTRNIAGLYCATKNEAVDKILGLIPAGSSVGFSGSVSLEQIGIISMLEKRGNVVANPYKQGISRQESLFLRKKGAVSDFYLASPNGVSENGELVFFSAFGNRIAGISYADNLILVAGINKIVPNLEEAIKRSRLVATPLNCKRLNWQSPCFSDGVCKENICRFPEHKRMCCQILIIEAEIMPGRIKVILVDEELGF